VVEHNHLGQSRRHPSQRANRTPLVELGTAEESAEHEAVKVEASADEAGLAVARVAVLEARKRAT